ncbi:ATP-binding protein [Bacillus niameyensis]|uniref:ATP-binding protein n=1 Tax=Bacillus niameyensis TaxID=1522308 RepID=UPI000785730C|nr:ATP-binding protein [Bacillus niameyensis]
MLKIIKSKTFLIACLFFLALTSLRVMWLAHHHHSANPPVADEGILDLREWDFAKEDVLPLEGDWEFFPNQLLTSGDNSKGLTLSVPSDWNEHFSEQNIPAYGFGTYRLKILLPKEASEQEYKIKFPSIRTAGKLFINGAASAMSGHPSTSPETHKASALPISSGLKANQSGEIELLLHVSNYDHAGAGGIQKPIQFGTLNAVNKDYYYSASMQFLVIVVMLIHSLYAFILFTLKPKKKELLFFALGIFFFAICVGLDDDRLLLTIFHLNYEWYYRLIKFSFLGMTACLLQYINHLFFAQHKHKILNYLSIVCTVVGIIDISLPLKYITLIDYNFILLVLSFCTIIFLVFKSIIIEKRDLLFILLAAISAISSLLWGILRASGITPYFSFYPYDLIIAIVCFSTFWFKQFFQESEEKEKLNRRLQKEDQLKDEFLANTSHELRNPLHGIINIAESILSNKNNNLDQTTKSNLELLITISSRMSFMLNDLIDITRMKELGFHIEKQSVNIRTVVSGVFDMFQYMLERKPVHLVIDIPDHYPDVFADKNRLIQILYNLVHNAIKFTNKGTILIKAEEKHGQAQIHVIDTGIGINEQTQKNIFEPYEQGTSGMTEGGLGLGLNISKQLVEMHGGTLTVDSTLGKGSIFTFTLDFSVNTEQSEQPQIETPYKVKQSKEVELEQSFTKFDGNRPKILAVDDDAVNLKVLSNILPENEYDLVSVTSGEEALDYLTIYEWDLIIVDVMMPNMSGYALTRRIRQSYLISELPVLLLTARSDEKDVITGLLSGANDYVTKPINGLELKARVNGLTNLKQSINQRLRMEAAWLQAQIQPHFLFNTLNTIASLSELDTVRMATLLDKFGQYLQKSFDPINLQSSVPLEHELDLVRAYLHIEQERFGNMLKVEWAVDGNLDLYIPPLSIQTLVENAIRHGVLKQIHGGTVLIKITNFAEFAEVKIEDNGVGMDETTVEQLLLPDDSKRTRGIGLINTNKRLKQLYGTGLTIQSTLGKGTTISFAIQKAKMEIMG